VVTIRDSQGNTVSEATTAVTVAIQSGTGGTLGGTTTVNAVAGVATFSGLTLAGKVGTNYVLRFTATGLTQVDTGNLTVTAGAATQLALTTQPVAGETGKALTTQPVVTIRDSAGNTVTTATAAVTVAIGSGTGGTLGGTKTVNAVAGVVTFSGLTLAGTLDTEYVLRFTATGLTSADSAAVKVRILNILSISRVGSNPSSANSLSWTITFSESVSGLTAANLALTGSTGATITGVSGSGTTWTVTVNPGTAGGSVGLSMANSTGVANSAGLGVTNVPFATGDTFTIAPRIVSVDQTSANPIAMTSTSTPPNVKDVIYIVRFNENVTGVTAANFELTGTSAAGSTVQSVTGSGKDWTVTVRVGGTGMVALRMKDSTGVTDSETNAVGGLPYTTTNYYQVAPRVLSMVRANPNPAGTTTVGYTVTFSETVTGVTAANFVLVTTGTAGATVTGVTGSGTSYTATVNLGASTGSVSLRFANTTGIKDVDNLGVAAASMPFTGETYLVAPRILSIKRAGGPTTSELFTNFTVTFSESVTGLTNANFTIASTLVALTGSSTVTIGSITGTGATRTVRLNLPEGKGSVGLNLTTATGIKDADNLALANAPLTGETVTVIAVKVTNTTKTTPPTPPRRPGGIMSARDNNIARLAETQADRMANGDIVYLTVTLENTSGPRQEMWLRAPIPERFRAIPWPYFPEGARDIPWGYYCDRGDCMVKSPRSDQEILKVPGTTTSVNRGDNSGNLVSEASATKDVLYPELFKEQELVWHGTLDVGEMVTLYYAVQISNQEPNDMTMSIPSYVALTYDDAMPGMYMKMMNGAPVTTKYIPTAPGDLALGVSPAGGQRMGSVLVYPLYTSSVNTARQDSRFTLTNTSPDQTGYVHLFFVDGSDCSVADRFVTLTPNQTTSFRASDLDPLVSGYLIAVAVDENGCPKYFNHLIGEVLVKFESGHKANLPAVGIAALSGGLAPCYASDATAELAFDGISYNEIPRTIALSNIAPRAEGNDTMLVINRIGGDMAATGGLVLGPLAGVLYDDLERSASFTMAGQACQMRTSLTGSSLRTTPRFENMVPSGRSGWFRIASAGDEGIIGAVLNSNPNGFTQGHVLHTLSVTRTVVLTIPVAPPE
jgi:hypothetical protein